MSATLQNDDSFDSAYWPNGRGGPARTVAHSERVGFHRRLVSLTPGFASAGFQWRRLRMLQCVAPSDGSPKVAKVCMNRLRFVPESAVFFFHIFSGVR